MNILQSLNEQMSKYNTPTTDMHGDHFLQRESTYALGNPYHHDNCIASSSSSFIDSYTNMHGLWMYTLLNVLKSIDLNVLDLDMVYTFAVSRNTAYKNLMESMVTPDAVNSDHTNATLSKIIASYGDIIRRTTYMHINDMLLKIYTASTKNKSWLIPLPIEARSVEYIRGRIKHINQQLDGLISHLSKLNNELDIIYTAVVGYRQTYAYNLNHKSTQTHMVGISLTSDDMMDLLQIANTLLTSGNPLFNDEYKDTQKLRLVVMIYSIIHEFCGNSYTGTFQEDYRQSIDDINKNNSTALYRERLSRCRSMSGISPTALIGSIGTIDNHYKVVLTGNTVAPINPDSPVEQFLFMLMNLTHN